MNRFEVGDIVLFDQWKLCVWEITKLTHQSFDKTHATLKLLGGQALPPGWNETAHVDTDSLVHAGRFLNEMEILAWAAQDTLRTD